MVCVVLEFVDCVVVLGEVVVVGFCVGVIFVVCRNYFGMWGVV